MAEISHRSRCRAGRLRHRGHVPALLVLLSALLAAGCGDLVVDVDAPLLVLETYPASGSTVPREALSTLRVTFSSDLGPRASASSVNQKHFLVEATADGGEWEPLAIQAFGYEQQDRTMVISLSEEELERVTLNWQVRLAVLAGLESDQGSKLVRDHYAFFRLGE